MAAMARCVGECGAVGGGGGEGRDGAQSAAC